MGLTTISILLATASSAHVAPPVRITPVDARYAAKLVYQAPAGALNERLVITPCKPKGVRSRVCVVRYGPERFRFVVRYAGPDKAITASATRL